jgi:hypothetical protein
MYAEVITERILMEQALFNEKEHSKRRSCLSVTALYRGQPTASSR